MSPFSAAIFWLATGFASAVVYCSFFEWTLHRYIMHRPLGKFRYPFESHALIHHRVFKADNTYHLIHPKDAKTRPKMLWKTVMVVDDPDHRDLNRIAAAMLAAGAPYFDKEIREPEATVFKPIPDGRVNIGTPEVIPPKSK